MRREGIVRKQLPIREESSIEQDSNLNELLQDLTHFRNDLEFLQPHRAPNPSEKKTSKT
jgi:hypothetical protein